MSAPFNPLPNIPTSQRQTMELLKDYTDAQVREMADEPTPQPMAGAWTLTAPDGRKWVADSPIRCMHAEINDRVPPLVALARIKRALLDDAEEQPI